MMHKVPLFDLNFDEQEVNAVVKTLRTKWISTGPKCQEFESKFAEMLGLKYAVSLSNCTSALHLALVLLGIRDEDEVICPSLTFVATINAIRYVNAVPVFCDITSNENLNIDAEKIEKLITDKTRAIMIMHYGGFACDMDKIVSMAKKHNLKIIEDACHGPMSEYKKKKLGTIGDIGCFSFFSNKNISTGEGGMLVTNNEAYFERAKLLRSHGMTTLSYQRAEGHATGYDVIDLGYNYRMDDIRATIGIVQLEKLQDDLNKRAEIRKYYIDKLSETDKIIVPFKDHPYFSSNYIFSVVLKDSVSDKRDLIRNKLAESGIQTSVHYPAVHRFKIYKDFYRELSVTDYVNDNLITFPMYSALSLENVDFIVKTFIKVLNDK
jgi:dTDP-4-amino-4,6-dideoxygalactose transaminase